jgi:inorganic phosphate transporter, PiT family
MSTTLLLVSLLIVTALFFDFTNGFHDSGNAMATSVATGALAPEVAVTLAAVLNVAGAFLSTEVAKTISGARLAPRDIHPAAARRRPDPPPQPSPDMPA